MSTSPPPRQTESLPPESLDPRLIQWMAVQMLDGRYARLMDAGASPDARIDLARIFIDLPVRTIGISSRSSKAEQTAMSRLLTRPVVNPLRAAQRGRIAARPGWLLLGGPGSGKSTLTTMVAQVLRLPWIERQVDVLPDALRKKWNDFHKYFRENLADFIGLNEEDGFPIRIDLPNLAQWLSGRLDDESNLWDYLAAQATRDLRLEGIDIDLPSLVWQSAMTTATPIVWILDGLDEVSRSAGRQRVIGFIRKTISSAAHGADRLLVATRPQGYTGEFDELDEMELVELDSELARKYGEKLLRAWTSGGSAKELDERLQRMEAEFGRAEIEALLTTPLHTTLAALLVCGPGKLPSAQCALFDAYFELIFKRELGKPFEQGIQDDERDILRTLHARAGLALHVRAQDDDGVDPSLRRRNLREILTQVYKEQRYQGDELQTRVDRMMRFATDRLVLLLHSSEGEYSFGVRSLQEYFAADALLEGETADVRRRIGEIVLDPHWSGVLELMTSRLAQMTDKVGQARAFQLTASICEDLNAGRIGGEAAKRCFMGSRMALAMLYEIMEYGRPWLYDPLWKIALEAAESPSQQGIVWFTEARRAASRTFSWTDVIDIHYLLGLWAASWTAPNASTYQTCILNAAQKWLSQSDNDAQLNGWRLLAGFLSEENREAIQLADEFAPTSQGGAESMVRAMLGLPIWPAWLLSFIDQHQDWLTPACGYPHSVDETTDKLPLSLEFYGSILNTAVEGEDAQFLLTITHTAIQNIDQSYWQEFELKVPNTTSQWRAWKAIARFYADPNHLRLAEILEALAANEDAFSELNRMASLFPWPIQACLEGAQSPRQAADLANRVKSGELGTIDDWRAAEARWQLNTNHELDEFISSLTSDLPWSRDIAEHGIVLTSNLNVTQTDHESMRRLNAAVLHCIDMGTAKHPLTLKFFLDTANENEKLPSQITVALTQFLVKQLSDGEIRSIREFANDPSPYGRFVYFVLLMLGAEASTTSTELTNAFEAIGLPHALLSILYSLVKDEPEDPTPMLLAGLDGSPTPTGVVRDILLGALFSQLRDSVTPSFITSESWTEYAFDEPFLSSQSPQLPPRLVRIDDIRHIRLFKEVPRVDDPFPTPNADHGQWIVFIGENGAGKTTLLRTLALTLAPPTTASKLLDEKLPLLTNGSEGRVEILLETGKIGMTLRRLERTEVIESTTPDAVRPWVVAYGVRRGNARGEQDRDPETGPLGELHTLFDRPASLHNATTWLKDLDAEVMREQRKTPGSTGPRQGIWNAVVKALKKLLGVSTVEVAEGGIVFVEHAHFGRVRLDALSDGYLTTAGWVIDMIARWIERQRELDEPVGANLLHQMTGFVLIDEIDLHLHPMWQLRIIDDIRALFPRLSFLVTTHNPLTLQGARRGEIFVMRREGKRIEITQKNIRPGQDVDRVLLEQFGVEHTFDKETRDLLTLHRQLLEKGVPHDDVDRQKVEAQLAERMGDTGRDLVRARDTSPLRPEEHSLLAPFLKKKPGIS